MNSKELDDYLSDWGLQLEETITEVLHTEYGKKFCWEQIESFECMVDEITRLHRVIDFHDILSNIPYDNFLNAINGTGETLEDILSDFVDYYISVPLGMKLDKEKIINEFLKKLNGENSNE